MFSAKAELGSKMVHMSHRHTHTRTSNLTEVARPDTSLLEIRVTAANSFGGNKLIEHSISVFWWLTVSWRHLCQILLTVLECLMTPIFTKFSFEDIICSKNVINHSVLLQYSECRKMFINRKITPSWVKYCDKILSWAVWGFPPLVANFIYSPICNINVCKTLHSHT